MPTLIRHMTQLLTLEGAAKKQGRRISEIDLGLQTDWAMLIDRGQIQWMGPDRQIPKSVSKLKKIKEISGKAKTILPGFVECHSHTIFAGHRADEFELLQNGASYSDIAAQGGGILSTVTKTRKATRLSLVKKTQAHVNRFVAQGVTTLEVKSGYALSLANEIKLLEVAQKIKGPLIVSTFLGAHAKPPEFSSYEDYLLELEQKYLPIMKKRKLATRVDIFVEAGFFPVEPARRYLKRALELGFQVVVHADQLSLSGGADLAMQLGAQSADHLIRVGETQIRKLAQSEVTCVLLPAADLYLSCPYPPARKLLDAGARVALATDFNPGSSPTQDLALVGLLARLQMKMTLPEVISAYTVGASWALGLQDRVGSLSVGKSADFLITEKDWKELFFSVGDMGIEQIFREGRRLNAAL